MVICLIVLIFSVEIFVGNGGKREDVLERMKFNIHKHLFAGFVLYSPCFGCGPLARSMLTS